MRTPLLTRKTALVAASIFWVASGAAAELPEGLAPPGPCAEPREALAGTAIPGSGDASPMAVVGSLQSLFSPNDVAAAADATPTRPAPSPAAPVRYPGACEAGGSACQQALAASPGPRPVTPGTRGDSTKPGFGSPGAPPPSKPRPVVPGGRKIRKQ